MYVYLATYVGRSVVCGVMDGGTYIYADGKKC